MSDHTKKIVSMLDELAERQETDGEFSVAAELDAISALVVTACKDIPPGVSRLADNLQRHFPAMEIEHALHTAQALYAEHECTIRKEDEEDEEAEEKEGDGTGAGGILPLNGYGVKEKRQGPRPADIPIGTPEWWKNNA